MGLAVVSFTLALLFAVTEPSWGAPPTHVIKFATVAPEGSAWMKSMRRLDGALREKSGGKLGFAFYAGGVAGDELDVLKKIRIGQIHCAAFSGVGFGQILPMVRVLDLPFLFRNLKEADVVHRELFGFFEEEFKKKGFELLAWAEVGNVHLFSRQPIRGLNDLPGLKVWTWQGDPIAKETFGALGVRPIPLAITDVTTALNTGMIDTVYAPPLGALALQWHTATKYMTSWPLVHATGAILLSLEAYRRLPPDLSALLAAEVKATTAALTEALRQQNAEAIRLIGETGISVLSPSDAAQALQSSEEVHRKVARALAGEIYPEGLLKRIDEILAGERGPASR
jgi:TRAP-type C4-dicarboxylate transport system substrate-binding protein